MDALALLCNLHASGPATLDRIRRLGVDTLSELGELGAETVARELAWQASRAERFLREAEVLARRLEARRFGPEVPGEASDDMPNEGIDEREDSSVSSLGDPVVGERPDRVRERVPAPPSLPSLARPSDAESAGPFAELAEQEPDDPGVSSDEEALLGSRATREGDPRDRVLGTWRELDEEEPPAVLIPRPPHARSPRSDSAETSAASAPGGNLESRGWIAVDVVRLLHQADIQDLRGLAEANAFELSEATGLGYTQILRLQGMARRELSAEPS